MLGFVGICGQSLPGEAPAPPSLEMLRDPGFDSPPDWTSAGGSTVSGSQLISLDDSGALPTYGALRDEMGGAFIPGATYRIRGTVGVLPGGAAFQIWLWADFGSEIIDGFSSADPIDQTFVAGGTFTSVEIKFFELGIRLNDLSIELVPPP